jgi:hypothetical protein
MKKLYLKPCIEEFGSDLTMMLCGSQGITSNKDIDYGGVDNEGTLDPSSRRYDAWDDDETSDW